MTDRTPSFGSVAVIILTYNEAGNIAQALSNVIGWADQVFVLDSMSTDGTVAIAKQYECDVAQHPFEDYSKQRNYALESLPIRSEWVFFLDADERLTELLKEEIASLIATSPRENGFYVNRRFIWMGRWIRRGYYPTWILRLLRHGKGRCEKRAINEQLFVKGPTGYLSNDLIHEDKRGIGNWIAKHNRYASLEALELARTEQERRSNELAPRLMGSQAERKRWIRRHVWNRLPPIIRPVAYFCYRYVLRLGFLDGVPGVTFHFLQALWYPMLIDIKYLELRALERQSREMPTGTPDTASHEQVR
jgi:glycosyltransferase involved in cell wall biosynthesis